MVKKDKLLTWALPIISLFILFLICEAALRIYILFHSQIDFESAMKNLPPIVDNQPATLGQIIRPNNDPKIIYELRPGISVECFGAPAHINAQGWRDDHNFTLNKPSGTVRIIGLGDSYMFGQGVAQNKNYLSFLEEGLNTKFPQKHWEIINTAVPGYNTVMEVETLAQKALRYHPDIVIIERIGNDLDLPNFIYEPDNWLDFRKSFFWGFINLKGLALQREFCLFDAPVVIKNGVFERFENNPKKLPAYCRNLVGKGPYKKAFYYLKFLSQKNHFIVISLLTIKPGHQNSFSYELSKKLGFYTTFNEVFDPAKDISLALNKNDRHPSEKGHMIIAKFLLGFMESEKIIDRFLLEK